MGFTLQVGQMTVRADSLAELLALTAALSEQTAARPTPQRNLPERHEAAPAAAIPPPVVSARPAPAPAAKSGPKNPKPGHIEERGGRFFLKISVANRAFTVGKFSTRAEAEAAQKVVLEARLRGEPIPGFTLTPTEVGPRKPKAGCISKRGEGWALVLSIDGKSRWGGSYPTREAAEAARDQMLAARLRGEELPAIPRLLGPRRCKRCGVMGHDNRSCTGEQLPQKIKRSYPPKPPRVLLTKEQRSAAMREGWAVRNAARAAARAAGLADAPPAPPAPAGPRVFTPEYRAKVSEGMRRVWAERRAAIGADASETLAKPARAPMPVHALAPAPPSPRPQLPPRCTRCIRVGHVEADCPRATLAADTSSFRPSNEVEKEELSAAAVDGGNDPEESADLTDLVEATDAPAAPAGPTLVTPPPSVPQLRPRALRLASAEHPPRTRGDCLEMSRPCPFTSCHHHLQHMRPGVPLADLSETCTLDVADRGGLTLDQIGGIIGVTRERIRQLEAKAIYRLGKIIKRRRIDFEEPPERRSGAAEDAAT